MDYLTRYYKNLSESLQERLNHLERLLKEEQTTTPSNRAPSPHMPGYHSTASVMYPELRTDKDAEETKKQVSAQNDKPVWTDRKGNKRYNQSEIDEKGRPTGVGLETRSESLQQRLNHLEQILNEAGYHPIHQTDEEAEDAYDQIELRNAGYGQQVPEYITTRSGTKLYMQSELDDKGRPTGQFIATEAGDGYAEDDPRHHEPLRKVISYERITPPKGWKRNKTPSRIDPDENIKKKKLDPFDPYQYIK